MNIGKKLTKINIVEIITSVISIIILDKLITLSYLVPNNTFISNIIAILAVVCIAIIIISFAHLMLKRKRILSK